jgi:prefoldin subunit 4
MASTSVASAGAMLQREDESEAEVRREDQDAINKFARLNARLHELRGERDALKV